MERDHSGIGELVARLIRRRRRGEGQGQGRLHRSADRRRLGQRHRRPQLVRSGGAAAQRRRQGEIHLRARGARRRMQAERGRSGGHQAGRRPGNYLGGDALLLGGGDRDGRHLSQVRPAGRGLGRGAARHHLPQQIRGDPSRQRHHDQPERGQCRAGDEDRLQDLRGHPRHHRLRQGPQPVFQRGAGQDGRQDPRHLRRHRRPAGLHRRAHADQGAQSGSDLFRRPHADRRAHPLADGQARHQGAVRRHLRHRVRRLHSGARAAGRRRARLPRRRAGREAARRQVLHGEIRRPEIRQPARGLWRRSPSPPWT